MMYNTTSKWGLNGIKWFSQNYSWFHCWKSNYECWICFFIQFYSFGMNFNYCRPTYSCLNVVNKPKLSQNGIFKQFSQNYSWFHCFKRNDECEIHFFIQLNSFRMNVNLFLANYSCEIVVNKPKFSQNVIFKRFYENYSWFHYWKRSHYF